MQPVAINQQNFFRMQATLAEYPILQDRIIEAMINQLVRDQVFSLSEIQVLIREKALRSQTREGLSNPFIQEGPAGWENRLARVRAHLVVDQYASQYPFEKFSELVTTIVENRPVEKDPDFFWHNVEYAPLDSIFEEAIRLERKSVSGDPDILAALDGAKTALIRRCLSEQPEYIEVAKKYLKIQDLYEVIQKKVGHGPIGGKAAGFILARTILQDSEDEEIRSAATTKDSYFVGADEFQTFLATNDLLDLYDSRYLPDQERWDRYPAIQAKIQAGHFPPNIYDALRQIINEIDGRPFIVRSSGLLEDSYRSSANGVYESFIIPNQGTKEDGLNRLLNAIRDLYAQVFSPQAIQTREKKKLLNFPERMAVIIQIIRGHYIGNYYFPDISGFAISKSSTRWSSFDAAHELDHGYTRFVAGLGGHALHRHGSDFSMVLRLDDPVLPEVWEKEIFRNVHQQFISAINLKTNRVELIDASEIPTDKYPFALFIAQNEQDGQLTSVRRAAELDRFVVNFHDLIKKTNFTKILREIMSNLDAGFENPTAIEFSVICDFEKSSTPTFRIQIDKCRPVFFPTEERTASIQPAAGAEKFIETPFNLLDRTKRRIGYVVAIDPKGAYNRDGLQYWLRTLNREMAKESFIYFSTRRFGVYDNGAGIRVKFADIQNAAAIVEVSDLESGKINDFPAGTQFYTNMIESGISYIPVFNGFELSWVDWDFFSARPDVVDKFIPLPDEYRGMIRVHPVKGYRGFSSLTLHSRLEDGKTTLYFE